MLASITPLGERSRGFSWGLTAAAFAAGALVAGALAGGALGALGSLLPSGSAWRGLGVAAVLALTLAFDATPLSRRLPSSRRQVNEDWLGRYRGWVYGIGFGAQLGVGVATIVTAAAVYATPAAALLCARPPTGAAIGATFGAVRGLSLIPAATVQDVASLTALHRRLGRAEADVRRVVALLELGLLVAVAFWNA